MSSLLVHILSGWKKLSMTRPKLKQSTMNNFAKIDVSQPRNQQGKPSWSQRSLPSQSVSSFKDVPNARKRSYKLHAQELQSTTNAAAGVICQTQSQSTECWTLNFSQPYIMWDMCFWFWSPCCKQGSQRDHLYLGQASPVLPSRLALLHYSLLCSIITVAILSFFQQWIIYKRWLSLSRIHRLQPFTSQNQKSL